MLSQFPSSIFVLVGGYLARSFMSGLNLKKDEGAALPRGNGSNRSPPCPENDDKKKKKSSNHLDSPPEPENIGKK